MENKSKKSGGAEISKRNRSLDLKSLYQSRVSEVEESKNKVSEGNDIKNVEKKKRKNRKEVSLISFESDAKKSRKEDVNGARSETGFGIKLSGGGSHSISLSSKSDAKKSRKEDVNGAKSENVSEKKLSGGSNGSHGISLSLKSDAKKSRKEDVNGAKSEIGSCKKLSGGSNGSHGISLSLKSDSKKDINGAKSDIGSGKKLSGGSNGSHGIPLSIKSDAKKNRKDDVNGTKSEIGSGKKLSGGSNGSRGISLSLSDTGFNIPRRPRGSVGRKKPESDQLSKSLGLPVSVDHVGPVNINVIKSEDDSGPNDGSVKFVALSTVNDVISNSKSAGKGSHSNSKSSQKADSKSASSLKLKRKAGADEVKERRNGGSDSVLHAQKEENLVVINGDRSSKKRRTDSRKKKDSTAGKDGNEASTKKNEPSVGNSISDIIFIDLVDDDDEEEEENLEQNAARMLSSRFDPSCTGFSSKKRTSTDKKPHGLSFPISPAPDSFNQKANFSGGEESASADDTSKHPGPRKRRHYYEILPRDLETSLVLNRRIKIFWPLDESWYDGLVNNYHAETNLYHVKYDDRDEEWVDLQEEKFKLLLFPSEVPGKARRKRHKSRDKVVHSVKTVPPPDNDSCIENNLDSEPIASWLARSTQRVKSSLKSRTSQKNLPVSQPLSSDKTDNAHSNSNVSDSHTAKNLADRESALPDELVVDGGVDKSVLQAASSQNEIFIVYSRRKYKKSEGNSSTSLVPVSLPITKEDTFYERCEDFKKQLWSIDDKGDLSFNFMLVDSKEFRMQICLPILPFLEFSNETEDFWMLHNILMLQRGTIVTTSPAVKMDIFLLDCTRGLRFLLFEGCLMQALAFVFLILVVFNPPDEQWNGDMQVPLTSISFRISSVQDLRKHHVFAFYSFSGLRSSKWLFLDSKLLQRCLLIKKLPVSECTYDNIKDLDSGSAQQRKSRIGLDVSSFQGCKKIFDSGILPMGVSNEACSKRMSLSTFDLAAKLGKVPQFALSFSAAPTFFRDLHLQLLMQHSFAWVNLQHHDTLCSIESSENGIQPVGENDTQFKPSLVHVEDIAAEQSFGTLETEVPVFRLSSSEHDMGTDVSANNSTEKFESSQNLQLQKVNRDGAGSEDTLEVIAHSNKEDPTSNPRCDSRSGGMIVDIPSLDQADMPFDGKGCISRQTSDMEWNPLDDFDNSPNPTGSRSSSRRARSSSISSLLGNLSPVFADGKTSFMRNGFSSGPKKPRTQVRYTLPYTGYDFSAKQKMQNQRALPCKRIRRASLKRLSDGSRSNQKNFELLSCSANILVTLGDKGWRECGAHVVLEVADHNEWRLAVKLSGITKYSYKVKHILQPGSTNRYSHAMMWKGGKDWLLEFPDRSQWMLFKEMHEECYNLNIRAASLKNIPIPGVQLIEENDDCGSEVTFVRNSVMYFRQIHNDVEMAMDPSRVLYDMDSDDEKWFLAYKTCTDKHRCEEITEEFLEKTIGIFEKVAYIQQRDNFTDAEIEELVIGIGSAEAAKVIYEHWRQKREKKGMPLIRHLQPPHWERYQQQLKEWEHTIARGTGAISVPPPEKPPMFAFCLKPRGLDVPNKGFKQRSHRKSTSGDPNNLLVSGRRSNGRTFGDGKVVYRSSLHEYKNGSPSLQASRKVLSPQDAHFSLSGVAEWNHDRKVNGNKPNKLGSNCSYYNQRTVLNGNEVQQWNIGSPVSSNQRHYYYKQGIEQLNGAELNEFQLRDVTGVAEHAVKMAKLKREKAQRLLNRADVIIHKAVVAIMIAEAIKAAHENTNGGN